MIPTDPTERDALAAEYVLGTLEAEAAQDLIRALPADAALSDAVAGWEARLAPLLALAQAEAPPPDLWQRIEATLDARAPATARVAPRRRSWLDPWRLWATGATAVAAGLAALVVLRPAEPPRLMTVLLSQRDQPAWMVEAERGAIRLAALNPRPVEPGRVFQLWALPQGATAPTSLGLIPGEGQITVTPGSIRPEPGMLIEITLEPPGGSPIGRPTGPVLFIGRLTGARSS